MKWIKGNIFGFLKMLNQIIHRFRGKIIDLWVDIALWHRGKLIDSFLIEHSLLHIHYLPPYHPELNCQERLWRMMRYEETSNSYFETMADLYKAIFKISQQWKPKKIKSLCQLI